MSRLPPLAELVNVLEFEDVAKLKLPGAAFSAIAGTDRAAFDRITFRPRMLVPTADLDLSIALLGETHFTPILVGPVSDHRRFHPDAELATIQGAAAAKSAVVVTSRSSVPIEQIAAQAKTPLWYSVYAEPTALQQAQHAVSAGCKVVCITIGVGFSGSRAVAKRPDWKLIKQLRAGLGSPVVLKGVMSPDDAKAAIEEGVQGIVVSNHGGVVPTRSAPIEVLASIVDAVGGKSAVLIDGSFRRGTDILKALALGAQGVLLGRPVMWGLASYGADGVQTVIEMLQSDLGRNMANIGAPDVRSLSRSMVRIHSR